MHLRDMKLTKLGAMLCKCNVESNVGIEYIDNALKQALFCEFYNNHQGINLNFHQPSKLVKGEFIDEGKKLLAILLPRSICLEFRNFLDWAIGTKDLLPFSSTSNEVCTSSLSDTCGYSYASFSNFKMLVDVVDHAASVKLNCSVQLHETDPRTGLDSIFKSGLKRQGNNEPSQLKEITIEFEIDLATYVVVTGKRQWMPKIDEREVFNVDEFQYSESLSDLLISDNGSLVAIRPDGKLANLSGSAPSTSSLPGHFSLKCSNPFRSSLSGLVIDDQNQGIEREWFSVHGFTIENIFSLLRVRPECSFIIQGQSIGSLRTPMVWSHGQNDEGLKDHSIRKCELDAKTSSRGVEIKLAVTANNPELRILKNGILEVECVIPWTVIRFRFPRLADQIHSHYVKA